MIDPNIILQLKPLPAFPDLMGKREREERALRMRLLQADVNRSEEDLRRESKVREILAKSGGDLEKALPELYAADPATAVRLGPIIEERRRAQQEDLEAREKRDLRSATAEAYRTQDFSRVAEIDPVAAAKMEKEWRQAQIDSFSARLALTAKVFESATDEASWQRGLRALEQAGEDVSSYPKRFDPQFRNTILRQALGEQEILKREKAKFDLETSRAKEGRDVAKAGREEVEHVTSQKRATAELEEYLQTKPGRLAKNAADELIAKLTMQQGGLTPGQKATIQQQILGRKSSESIAAQSRALQREQGQLNRDAQAARAAGKDTSTATAVDTILAEAERLSGRINVSEGVPAKVEGAVNSVLTWFNANPDMKEYESMLEGFSPLLARAVGHSGQLTERDVYHTRSLFPKAGDSKEIARRKLDNIRTVIQAVRSGKTQATTDDPAGIRGFLPPR